MNTRQFGIFVKTTLLAGVIGGALSNLVFMNTGVLAEESERTKKVVTGEEFRLVTKDGQPRATLLLWNGELPALTLADETCRNRVILGVFNEAQPTLILNDKGCKQRVALDLQPDGLPSLTLRDKNDVPRARLRVLLDGRAVLTLCNQNGQVAWPSPLSSSEP
jgi:hypothetical protein